MSLRRTDSSPERYTPTHGVRIADLGFTRTCGKCSRQASTLGWRKLGLYGLCCAQCVAAADARRAAKEAA